MGKTYGALLPTHTVESTVREEQSSKVSLELLKLVLNTSFHKRT